MTTIARRNTKIPVPKILTWDDDADNPVGSEYIIMSHAEGTELRQLWFGLDSGVQIECIRNITEKIAEMTRLKFSAFGSLCLRDSAVGKRPRWWLTKRVRLWLMGSFASDPVVLRRIEIVLLGKVGGMGVGRPYQCRTVKDTAI